jgi:hypothetical protein
MFEIMPMYVQSVIYICHEVTKAKLMSCVDLKANNVCTYLNTREEVTAILS